MSGLILPTIVSAVLVYILGALWYSPLMFAKPWMAAQGRENEEFDMKPVHFALTFATWAITAIMFTALVQMTGYTSFASMICLGIVAFLGFTLTPLVLAHIYEKTATTVTVLSIGYHLAAYLIMAIVHTLL